MLSVERLKSKKEISFVFENGESVFSFPVKLFYLKNTNPVTASVAFMVGKKNIRLAVEINLVKRRMRESFKLNCLNDRFFLGYSLVFVYLDKKVASFDQITKGFQGVLEKFNSFKKQ
jgi:ribonuclease P protein component